MVFSQLPPHEKEAFFSLLDEYFQSRPDLLPTANASSSLPDVTSSAANAGGAAASAVQRALASNPEATSKLVSAGLKHGVPKNSPYAAAAHNPEINNAAGRFAAASLAFSNQGKTPPPVAPRRVSNIEHEPSSISNPTPNPRNLMASRKFGDVDVSSTKNFFGSLRNSTANKTAPPPAVAAPVPSAFAAKKNEFAPPPVRRVPSSSGSARESSPQPTPPRRQFKEPEEDEGQGEWAEALYDYSSEDPGDISLKANQRVLVTERSSDDWWTGKVGGQKGLFPATYVKML
jgi:hypothetical protein